MSVQCMRCYEYTVTCDRCEAQEVYHTGDSDHGVVVHSIGSAIRASGYRRMNGRHLCPECQKEEE